MSSASKGTRMLLARKKWYEAKGYIILQAEQRTRYGQIDVGGAWDLWASDGREWVFEQVGQLGAKSRKFADCDAWIRKYAVPGSIRFRIALYRNPGYYGRGDKREYHPKAEWFIYENVGFNDHPDWALIYAPKGLKGKSPMYADNGEEETP